MVEANLYQNQFDQEYNFASGTPIKKTLIIASTPRCGSHLLGHSLYETKQFGFPLEYVQPANLNKWKAIHKSTDTSVTLDAIEKQRTSPNGVFSIKVHYSHLNQFGGFDRMLSRYKNPYIVLLSRSDVLNQAVSLSIARQSGVWISGQLPKSANIVYNYDEINYCLRRTLLHNAAWRYLLAASTCQFMELDFSKVKKELASSINMIASFMEFDNFAVNDSVKHVTKAQSNSLNQEWIEKFKKDRRTQDVLLEVENTLGGKSLQQRVKNKISRLLSSQ